MRPRLHWAYTLYLFGYYAFAKSVADASSRLCDQTMPAALRRRVSAGDRPGATANLSEFAKFPTYVLPKTLEI